VLLLPEVLFEFFQELLRGEAPGLAGQLLEEPRDLTVGVSIPQ
jgi:hypothetical protein